LANTQIDADTLAGFFFRLEQKDGSKMPRRRRKKKKEESAVKECVLHKKQKILIIRRTMDLGREEADFL